MTTKTNNSSKNGPSRFRKDAKSFSPSYLQNPVSYDVNQRIPVAWPPQMPMSPMNMNIPNPVMHMNVMPFSGNGPMMAVNPNQARFDYSSVYGQQQYPLMYPQYDYNQFYPNVPPAYVYYPPYDVSSDISPKVKHKELEHNENLPDVIQSDDLSSPEPKDVSLPLESSQELPKTTNGSTATKEPILELQETPTSQDSSTLQKTQDATSLFHEPIYINTSFHDISPITIEERKHVFETKSYDQTTDIIILRSQHDIIDYNQSPKSEPTTNWASVLTKPSQQPGNLQPVTPEEAAPIIKPAAKVEETREIDSFGKLSLKIMYDPEYSVIDETSNDEFYKLNPRGLTNTGNICYMNSILQVLIYCEPFNKLLKMIETKSVGTLGETSTTPLIDAVSSLFYQFTQPNLKSLSPESFYLKLSSNRKFQHLKWGQQEDAEEYLGYLLDGMHEEFVENIKHMTQLEIELLVNNYKGETKLNIIQAINIINKEDKIVSVEATNRNEWNEVGKKNEAISSKRTVEIEPSPIKTIFGGQFRSVLKLPFGKNSQSVTLDPYQCIQLDIEDESITTIEEAFTHLNEPEQIQFRSNDKDVIATKQTFIDNLPPILTIHLKRFSFQQDGNVEKITKNIKYDLNLTIPQEMFSSYKRNNIQNNYKLVGVVYHHGISAEGGHYTSDVLKRSKLCNSLLDDGNDSGSNDNNEWIRIDDTLIDIINKKQVVENNDALKSAYILFYQQL